MASLDTHARGGFPPKRLWEIGLGCATSRLHLWHHTMYKTPRAFRPGSMESDCPAYLASSSYMDYETANSAFEMPAQ